MKFGIPNLMVFYYSFSMVTIQHCKAVNPLHYALYTLYTLYTLYKVSLFV